MGIGNDKAKIHIELNKDPKTINLQLLPEIWAIIPATYLYFSNFASVLPPQIYLSILPTREAIAIMSHFLHLKMAPRNQI
jgi:hypothetical protein